jgi:hypothetical protein
MLSSLVNGQVTYKHMTQLTQSNYYNEITFNELFLLFSDFIERRPNLDYVNYGDIKSYRAEQRNITAQLHRARKALINFARLVALNNGKLNPEYLQRAFSAFSGRLSLAKDKNGKFYLDYCVGQYRPTEYRLASAVVLEAYNKLIN